MVTFISYPTTSVSRGSKSQSPKDTERTGHPADAQEVSLEHSLPLKSIEAFGGAHPQHPPPLYSPTLEVHDQSSPMQNIMLTELTNRPAAPPPFPSDLPDRIRHDEQRRQKRRKRLVIGVVSLLAACMLCIIIALAVLLGRSRRSQTRQTITGGPNNSVYPLEGNPTGSAAAASTVNTTVASSTPVITLTSVSVSTVISTATSNATTVTSIKFDMFPPPLQSATSTLPSIVTPASSATSSPSPTPTPTPQQDDQTCDNPSYSSAQPLYIAPAHCFAVTKCTESQQDISENECKNFCRLRFFPSSGGGNGNDNSDSHLNLTMDATTTTTPNTKLLCAEMDQNSMSLRVKSCCGLCGCFGGG